MPVKAKRPCNYPGCHELICDGRFCDEHKRKYDARRGSAASRGYDARWQKSRLAFLREHPLCVECYKDGRIVAATVVDHIIPHKGNQQLFWSHNNWQALCKMCHDRKTATEDGGFGNERR